MAKVALLLIAAALLLVMAAIAIHALSPLWHPVLAPAPLHLPGLPVTISHISGEDYWYDVAIGRRHVLQHHGGIGVAWETNASGSQTVNYVPTCQVFDPGEQVAGYRKAVEELAETLGRAEKREAAIERLESITGNRFGSTESWRKWLAANGSFLYFSTSSMKLRVDFGAATVGEPTRISRKVCNEPHYLF